MCDGAVVSHAMPVKAGHVMMRVLLIGPAPRVIGTYHPLLWLKNTAQALRRLGHSTTVFAYRESLFNSLVLHRYAEGVPGVTGWLARRREVEVSAWNRRLERCVRQLRPDLVIVLKGEQLSSEVLAQVKHLAPGPLVAWWIDDPWRYPKFIEHIALFDRLFVFDRACMEGLRDAGVHGVHFLPCAVDETVYRPLRLRPAERRRFGCDVVFVGWYYPKRGTVARTVAQSVDLGVWGGGWDSPEARQMVNGSVVRGGAVTDRTAAKIYSACQIGLNIHADQSRLGGLNMRTFEVLASGLFQLVDRIPGMEELLIPDREIVCYSTVEEACQLTKHYLNDASARLQIAARGRERVLAEHTYQCRMRTLFTIVCG